MCGNFIVNGIAFMLYFFFVNNKNAGCGSSVPGLFHPNIYYRTRKRALIIQSSFFDVKIYIKMYFYLSYRNINSMLFWNLIVVILPFVTTIFLMTLLTKLLKIDESIARIYFS